MVGLQGFQMSDAFWCLNVWTGVGLKSFCPWCFTLGGTTKSIAVHLREVHYHLAIPCNICKSFASMSTQVVLEHHSGCKVKSHKKRSKVKEQEKAS